MDKPSKALTGAVVAVYIAGEAGGALTQTVLGDKLGRIRFMQMMCIIVTIGTTVQTAAINMNMFLAGRVLAGFAVGGLVGTVPIYLSEISAPHQRGLIGGISGCGISFGTMVSNWVGMAVRTLLKTGARTGGLTRSKVRLRILRRRAMASSSRHSDPLGYHPLHRPINLHARLSAPIDPERPRRSSPCRIHQDPAGFALHRSTGRVCTHARPDRV